MAPALDAAYDSIAGWYDEWLGDGAMLGNDPFAIPLLELVGSVDGQAICDMGCGQGRIARHLAHAGARIVAIDASVELLAIAARYPTSDRIDYRHDDAHTLSTCQDAVFDGVICNMALMDIPDLSAAIDSAFRVLRPGGWFGFSTFHPCFNAPLSAELIDESGRSHRTVTGYFAEGHWKSDQRSGPPGKVGAYHRTLATYLNTLIDAGFTLHRLREVPSTTACWREVPPVLAAVMTKPT